MHMGCCLDSLCCMPVADFILSLLQLRDDVRRCSYGRQRFRGRAELSAAALVQARRRPVPPAAHAGHAHDAGAAADDGQRTLRMRGTEPGAILLLFRIRPGEVTHGRRWRVKIGRAREEEEKEE